MSAIYGNSTPPSRTARLVTCIMLATFGIAAHAQTPPYAEIQYSTLTGSGNTITISRVPVVTASGTSYVNVVVEFDVAADGTFTVASGYPTTVPAPPQLISNFLAGNSIGPSGIADGKALITVYGPGVTSGGATEWSLTTPSGANCYTPPTSATWYVFGGPMTNNPMYARLKAAGITSQMYGSYSWGVTGDQSCLPNGFWNTNTLIGLSQTGTALTIASFTSNGVDKNQPVDMIPYTNTNP